MDPEWNGRGYYRPADGSHWNEATGETEWIACGKCDEAAIFYDYEEFKKLKGMLRLKDRLLS